MDTDMALGISSGLNVILDPGGKQAADISPFLTILTSSELPLTTANGPFFLSLPLIITYLLILMSPTLKVNAFMQSGP